jgi:hypothetical protein
MFVGSIGAAIAAPTQEELNALLKGSFRFTLNQTCTYSQAGFLTDPPGGDVLGQAQSGEDFIQGVAQFNGDGTFTAVDKGVYQAHGQSFPGYFPISTYTDYCRGVYKVNADLSYATEVSCVTVLHTGFFAGATITASGIRGQGQLSAIADSFVAGNVAGTVNTQYFSTGLVQQRICGVQSSGIKIPAPAR